VSGLAQPDVPVTLRELANPNIRRLAKSTLVTSLDEAANTTYKANE
jgi:hypothetical protein